MREVANERVREIVTLMEKLLIDAECGEQVGSIQLEAETTAHLEEVFGL